MTERARGMDGSAGGRHEAPDAGSAGARPWVLAECTWRMVRETRYEVAVLPWGATEAHNLHLPYGTDNYESDGVAAEAARRAWERGARVAVLPTVPFGVNTGQLDIPLTLNVNPSTQLALLGDVAAALAGQGVHKLVLLNGHGGNNFRQMIRELQPHVDMFICAINWYDCVDPRPFFDEPGDHAGELETSVMLHLAPRLVRPLDEAGPGRARPWSIAGLREGWAWAPRQWTRVTSDTGTGNPARATPAKGAAFVDAVAERLAGFLVELAATDLEELYEGEL
ncbi:MAG TPA: creatininase family protein [Gemmatimonadales bacterium]